MPGAGRTHGPPATRKAGGSHHRSAETSRHSLRNGVTAYTRSPRCTGLFSHRRRRIIFRRLDPSVGRSGPRDFAVRASALRRARQPVHRIPPPTFVTIGRSAPPVEAGCGLDSTFF